MYKTALDLDFERHPIRKLSISWIELRFPNGSSHSINPLTLVRGIRNGGDRPNSFIWHNPKAQAVTPILIKWIEKEFRHIFNSDRFLWSVSSTTAPEDLQQHLLELL